MNPTLDLRIASLIRVMKTLLVPALQDALAMEAAVLVIRHLELLRDQVDHHIQFERGEHVATLEFAQTMVDHAADALCMRSAADWLQAVIDSAPVQTAAGLRHHVDDLNEAVIALLDLAQQDEKKDMLRVLQIRVLMHGLASANNSRIWFAGTGFEQADQLDEVGLAN
jgi:hypothetical protein